jgi:DNA-binding transcriptional ArsR family regulator
VAELVEALSLTQPQVSKHLRILKAAQPVRADAEAQQRFYSMRLEPLRELDAWLAPYRRMWNKPLGALERRLDARPDTPAAPSKRSRP